MIHHPVAGGLPLLSYVEFVFVVILVMQVWLYQTLYINRYGRSRAIDVAGLLISMYAMTYLANHINTTWSLTFRPFNTAVLLIIAGLLVQYMAGSCQHPLHDRDVRSFIITLTFEFIAVLAGLLIGYHGGIYLCILGGLIGFLMPLLFYRSFQPDKVNFPHFVERVGLIIIITYGEMVVNITRYFTGSLFQPVALMMFVLLAAMFGTYVIQSDRLINHHQRSRGFILMYSHVFMVVALLSFTAGLDYLADQAVSRIFLWAFLAISFLVNTICVLANGAYNRRHYKLHLNSYLWLGLAMIVGLVFALIARDTNLGLVTGFALASLGQCGYLLNYSRTRR